MSTPSIVAIKTRTGYSGIYVHFDGNSQYMRDNLKKFNTRQKVNKLIALGDMSAVMETLEKCERESYYYKAYNTPGYEHMQREIYENEYCFDAEHYNNLTDLHNDAKDRDCQLYVFDDVWMKEDEEGFLERI